MRLRCRIPLANFELDVDTSFDARITAIFGPSGSGKTSLLDAIAGLRDLADGEIEIGGKLLFSSARNINLPARQRNIGYVPQEAALFPHLSVEKNILFGAYRSSRLAPGQATRLEHALNVLEIAHLLPRAVTRLSGGEAQRVALARAILSRPQLLLLDEPLAALDVGLKERILPYLARVRDEFGIPMIYVTHNITEVLTLADWVLVLQKGKLAAVGEAKHTLGSVTTLRQLQEEHLDNVFSATFVRSDRQAGNTRVRLSSGTEVVIPYLPQLSHSFCQIRVSADDILVATEPVANISAANILPGFIRKIEAAEGEVMLTIDAGEEFFVRVTAAALTRLQLGEGMPVFLIIKTRAFRVV